MRNHYADPTANTAIANVEREIRRQKKLEEIRNRAQREGTPKASGRSADTPARHRPSAPIPPKGMRAP